MQKASFPFQGLHLTTAFAKPAEPPKILLAKLKAQGLQVSSDVEAIKYITYVGHYRLKGYWFHLTDVATKQFNVGASFQTIIDRYECDREIRALIFEAVERLEVAIRNSICNYLSLKYSPHWYLDASVFKPGLSFGIGQMLSKIEQEIGRSKEKKFIEAYYATYDEPYLPPSWAMCECVTLGIWSRLFAIIRDPSDKKSIAAKFGVTTVEVFESWLHTLTVLRNMAAHHDRFLHTKLRVSPSNYKANTAKKIQFADNKSVYAALTMIHVLLESIQFNSAFKGGITALRDRYGMGMMQELGFPNNWPVGAQGW